jgi:hypothetical protein
MPGCALTTDYLFGCDTGSGGIKECYLMELENLQRPAVGYAGEAVGLITAIPKVATKVWRKYQLVLDTASFDEDIVGSRVNGTLYYSQKGTIIINKQNVAVRNELLLLAKNRLSIITKDNNEAYKMYGIQNGMMLETGGVSSGVAWGDRNGYTLNFTGKEFQLSAFVADAVIATLTVP